MIRRLTAIASGPFPVRGAKLTGYRWAQLRPDRAAGIGLGRSSRRASVSIYGQGWRGDEGEVRGRVTSGHPSPGRLPARHGGAPLLAEGAGQGARPGKRRGCGWTTQNRSPPGQHRPARRRRRDAGGSQVGSTSTPKGLTMRSSPTGTSFARRGRRRGPRKALARRRRGPEDRRGGLPWFEEGAGSVWNPRKGVAGQLRRYADVVGLGGFAIRRTSASIRAVISRQRS